MKTPLKILLLEDNELDQKVLQAIISQSDLDANIKIVDNEQDYLNLLREFKPDIVLADFVIPGFGGMEALHILKKECPDTPFIFVTGQLSEETAIECLKDGAWDYILKSRIKRLPVAIKSAIQLHDEKAEKERIIDEIKESEHRFKSMAANINDGILIIENRKVTFINDKAKELLRFEDLNPGKLTVEKLIPEDKRGWIKGSNTQNDQDDALPLEFEKYYPNMRDIELCLMFKCTKDKYSGQPQNYFITISDITQKYLEQHEESLKLKFTSRLIEARNLDELFLVISNSLDTYLNIKNFAIALHEAENDMISVVYLKDEKPAPKYFPAGNTFINQVIKNQELVFLKDAEIRRMVDEKLISYVGERALVWMGVPFETARYKGAVVIQDYQNENLISKNDVGILKFITEKIGLQLERKFFIEDLKASENKFRELFLNISSGVAILSPLDYGNDFVLKGVNKSAMKIFKGVEQVINIPVRQALTSGNTVNIFTVLQKVYNTGTSLYLPVNEYKTSTIHYWLDFYIYKLTSGEIVVVFDDHTSRIHAQELIRENENRYRILSELTFEGILIHEKGIIADCNQSFAHMFGYEANELIGLNFIESLIADESKALIIRNFSTEETKPIEIVGIKKNGERFPIEQEAKSTKIDGKLLRVVAIRDISQRLKAREEIRLSEEKFNKISSSAHDAIILIDHDGLVSFWNNSATQIFQYSKEEILGKNFHHLIAPPNYHAAHQEGFTKFLQTGEGNAVGKTVELEAIRKDGEIIPVELSLSAIKMNGKWNAVGIVRDITARKKYETEILAAKKQAEEMNRLKTNFLSTMSHELRTPLNGILGFAEILKSTLDDAQNLDYVDIILKSSMRLLNTFNLIIDLSVIEANELKVRKKPEDIAQLVDIITEPYKAEAETKGLYLDVIYKTRNAKANTDQTLFNQALNNLLNNAVKYTQVGGIRVTLDEVKKNDKTWFSVSVADTGIGISEKNVSMIYDAFRQASEGYNRAFEGTGLGLHITRRYVDLLEGTIELESEPDKGSAFTIFIPKYVTEPINTNLQIETSDNPIVVRTDSRKLLNVLYVEDDADHREFVRLFLKNLYEVNAAIDGPESIRMATEKLYDIILMDINLGPKMNGLEAIKEIRKIEGYQNVPIAAVTANAMVSQKNEFLSEGCTHYISKPFNKKKLIEFLDSVFKD